MDTVMHTLLHRTGRHARRGRLGAGAPTRARHAAAQLRPGRAAGWRTCRAGASCTRPSPQRHPCAANACSAGARTTSSASLFAAFCRYVGASAWLQQPRLGPAMIVGIGTVAAPFLLMQPGMGARHRRQPHAATESRAPAQPRHARGVRPRPVCGRARGELSFPHLTAPRRHPYQHPSKQRN